MLARLAVAWLWLQAARAAPRPHIVFIVADDLGWNDVGFHGSNQIPTPNIDALAYSGVILNRYYVTPICTPSRSALMTGKHPIHTGMQHGVLEAAEPRGLPLAERLLPQYLQEMGYSTHAVGKWHLGFYKKEYTPTYRGFDTHYGFWTGRHDYNDHTAMEEDTWGLDMRRGMEADWRSHGSYTTDILTSEAVDVISRHNASSPLFLYLAHAAVHSANPYNPLPAPDHLVAHFRNITDFNRSKFAAMLSKLDDSVGKVVHALQKKSMLADTIIVFTTDNGGPAAGFNLNAASNWPLRGVKWTLWEGGVRGVGFVWCKSVTPTVSHEKIHISDWLPTLLTAANYTKAVSGLDGVDAWPTIHEGVASRRDHILHNIDPIDNSSALTINHWKIIKGGKEYRGWDGWYGPSGRDQDSRYDTQLIIGSPAGRALEALGKPLYAEAIWRLRLEAQVSCRETADRRPCKAHESPCLFNTEADPCELDNLAEIFPSILKSLEEELGRYNASSVAPSNAPADPRADPSLWNHTWTNFADFPPPPPASTGRAALSR